MNNTNSHSDTSYYDILELPKTATDQEIKAKYRELIRACHPDKLTTHDKEWGDKRSKELNEAWETLKDPERRKSYDIMGKAGAAGNPMTGAGFPFGSPFGGGFPFGSPFGAAAAAAAESQIPAPISIHHDVTLEDIYNGSKLKMQIERDSACADCDASGFSDKQDHKCTACDGVGIRMFTQQIAPGFIQQHQKTCNVCSGMKYDTTYARCNLCTGNKVIKERLALEFDLPRGVSDKETLQLLDLGNENPQTKKRGPIHIIINTLPHAIYSRGFNDNTANLWVKFDISLVESLCGFRRSFTSLDCRGASARVLSISESRMINNNTIHTILNEGLSSAAGVRGNLYIIYNVVLPTQALNKTDRQSILSALSHPSVSPTIEEYDKMIDSNIPADAVKLDVVAENIKNIAAAAGDQQNSANHNSQQQCNFQ